MPKVRNKMQTYKLFIPFIRANTHDETMAFQPLGKKLFYRLLRRCYERALLLFSQGNFELVLYVFTVFAIKRFSFPPFCSDSGNPPPILPLIDGSFSMPSSFHLYFPFLVRGHPDKSLYQDALRPHYRSSSNASDRPNPIPRASRSSSIPFSRGQPFSRVMGVPDVFRERSLFSLLNVAS